jgi:hypothetical protein
MTVPDEAGQHSQRHTPPEPDPAIEQLEDQRFLPERKSRVWKFIAVAVLALVLAVSTRWWGVTAVMP